MLLKKKGRSKLWTLRPIPIVFFFTIKIHVCPIQIKKEIHVYVKNMYLDIYLLFR